MNIAGSNAGDQRGAAPDQDDFNIDAILQKEPLFLSYPKGRKSGGQRGVRNVGFLRRGRVSRSRNAKQR